jgi:hypothetical protein
MTRRAVEKEQEDEMFSSEAVTTYDEEDLDDACDICGKSYADCERRARLEQAFRLLEGHGLSTMETARITVVRAVVKMWSRQGVSEWRKGALIGLTLAHTERRVCKSNALVSVTRMLYTTKSESVLASAYDLTVDDGTDSETDD